MIRQLAGAWRPVRLTRLLMLMMVAALGLTSAATSFTPGAVFADDLSAEPKAVSPAAGDLRAGFQFVPEKSEQREPVPGIIVYEADFTRDQTPKNFKSGPIEIKTLVAKTANSQQAAEQFASSRQALTTASPAWVESKVAKLGDEATGLTMEGTSSEGPAVAHLYLFRRGAMVVGVTVAGLTKPTTMAEAEAVAAIILRKIDPSYRNQTGQSKTRALNPRPSSTNTTASSGNQGSGAQASTTSAQKVKVANTGGTGVRMRVEPSLSAAIASKLADGTVLEIVGEDKVADGHTWRNVRAPGDGRGWVASEYLVAASGSPATSTQSSATPASNTQSSSTGTSSSAASSSTDFLKVDVTVKESKVKGTDQTVNITVTKGGQPVSGAQVTVKTSPTGETPAAPPTDAAGKTSVTWRPTGSPGFIGVGVSALASDGTAGVGGASFEIVGR